jgi:hypothetical protein
MAGIGDPPVRRRVAGKVDEYGLPAANLVHSLATVGTDTVFRYGLFVFARARVTTIVTLGRYVHLYQNTTVGHDNVLAE